MTDNNFIPYKRRGQTPVLALKLDLDTAGFDYIKWGGVQHCKPGDFLVLNGNETYTVDAESFARTYEQVGEGQYKKVTAVYAAKATNAGWITTKEGASQYDPGDFLVYNDAAMTDGYAVKPEKFEELYEPAV